MKTQSSAILLVDISPSTKRRAALERRNVVPILAVLGLCLILGPLTASAEANRESQWQPSLILPPPNEPAPPPPQGENFLIDYGDAASSAVTNPCNSNAAADCTNVLELPRGVFLQRHRILAVNHETGVNGHLKHNRRREYYEENVDTDWSPEDESQMGEEDESPIGEERDLKLPPPDRTSPDLPYGGFIPLNPRGITVRPGERSAIPPTSPLLTPPPGSAAMPYVWRP